MDYAKLLMKTADRNAYRESPLKTLMTINDLKTKINKEGRVNIIRKEPYQNQIETFLTKEELERKINEGASRYKSAIQNEYNTLFLSELKNKDEDEFIKESRKQQQIDKVLNDPSQVEYINKVDPLGLAKLREQKQKTRPDFEREKKEAEKYVELRKKDKNKAILQFSETDNPLIKLLASHPDDEEIKKTISDELKEKLVEQQQELEGEPIPLEDLYEEVKQNLGRDLTEEERKEVRGERMREIQAQRRYMVYNRLEDMYTDLLRNNFDVKKTIGTLNDQYEKHKNRYGEEPNAMEKQEIKKEYNQKVRDIKLAKQEYELMPEETRELYKQQFLRREQQYLKELYEKQTGTQKQMETRTRTEIEKTEDNNASKVLADALINANQEGLVQGLTGLTQFIPATQPVKEVQPQPVPEPQPQPQPVQEVQPEPQPEPQPVHTKIYSGEDELLEEEEEEEQQNQPGFISNITNMFRKLGDKIFSKKSEEETKLENELKEDLQKIEEQFNQALTDLEKKQESKIARETKRNEGISKEVEILAEKRPNSREHKKKMDEYKQSVQNYETVKNRVDETYVNNLKHLKDTRERLTNERLQKHEADKQKLYKTHDKNVKNASASGFKKLKLKPLSSFPKHIRDRHIKNAINKYIKKTPNQNEYNREQAYKLIQKTLKK